MQVILCATRGGEASIRTQEHAIALAKERGARLVFVFALDVAFLDKFVAPHVHAVDDEIEHMAEFLLALARDRAEKEGIEADYVVREGALADVLVKVAREVGATLIVLGRPRESHVTTLEYLQHELLPYLERKTGAEVLLV